MPIPACEDPSNPVEYGGPSTVRPEEYSLTKCLKPMASGEVKSMDCVWPYPEWQLEPVMISPTEPHPDGRVRIRNSQGCLRVSGVLQYSGPVYNGFTCQRVPWLTTVEVGSCNDDQSHFYVVPWAWENTSPGLTSPDPWDRWRIRPAWQCISGLGQVVNMTYGDACVDANATGDGVLRVFWCHDSPRQQFRATEWY